MNGNPFDSLGASHAVERGTETESDLHTLRGRGTCTTMVFCTSATASGNWHPRSA